MTETQDIATPWPLFIDNTQDEYLYLVGDDSGVNAPAAVERANRILNAHDALVAACEAAHVRLKLRAEFVGATAEEHEWLERAEAALRLARGGAE